MSYDPEVDAAYVKVYHGRVTPFDSTPFPPGARTRECTVTLDVFVDVDEDGNILGLEILDMVKQLSKQV